VTPGEHKAGGTLGRRDFSDNCRDCGHLGFSAGEFYAAFIRRPKPDEKPMNKWLGRTIFAVVGVLFILSGFSDMGVTSSPTVATWIFQIFMGVVAIVLNLMRRPDEKPNWLARTFLLLWDLFL
jgi:hypothetical protein